MAQRIAVVLVSLLIVVLAIGSTLTMARYKTDLSRPEYPVMDFWSYIYSNGEIGRNDVWDPILGSDYAEQATAYVTLLLRLWGFRDTGELERRLVGLAFRGGFDPTVEMLSETQAYVRYHKLGGIAGGDDMYATAAVRLVDGEWRLLNYDIPDDWDGFERLADAEKLSKRVESGELVQINTDWSHSELSIRSSGDDTIVLTTIIRHNSMPYSMTSEFTLMAFGENGNLLAISRRESITAKRVGDEHIIQFELRGVRPEEIAEYRIVAN